VTIERATVRSAADRLVVSTDHGVEAVYCSGLRQTLLYPEVPAGLSAKPVLSMTTKDQPGGTVTITLAYLATGFDWDATYVGTLAPDGKSLSLLGWLTLASADDTSFADPTTAAVAGTINRSDDTREDSGREAKEEAENLNKGFGCWPAGTTSDIRTPPLPPPMMVMMAPPAPMADIVVTARRRAEKLQDVPIAVTARSESLGDLKLYRIPVPVTVAARSQKQVAFMVKQRVAGAVIYRARIDGDEPGEVQMLFRFRNRKQDGLGEPLPAGRAILYQQSEAGRLFVGETFTPDKTTDEDVELTFGEASGVTIEHDAKEDGERRTRHLLTIRNANPFPITFELDFPKGGETRLRLPQGRIVDKPGKRVWTATVPANGTLASRYLETEQDEK
jgi:hypothetical protein